MIGFAIVFGFVAAFAWTHCWLEKLIDWGLSGLGEVICFLAAALPWLIGLACFVNFMASSMDSAIEETSEPTCQVED